MSGEQKYMRVEFSNGELWDIPCWFIAADAAKYREEQGEDYEEEYERMMACEDELSDWAFNNMNWSDVKPNALRAQNPQGIDYEDEWPNVEYEFHRTQPTLVRG
jgi:hypothetical protein